MSNVRRVYVEKKPSFAVKAKELKHEISSYLGIQTVTNVRELIRYDVENISDDVFEKACHTVFAEPPVDDLYLEKFEAADGAHVFSVEFLPGQFDQRADSAVQCVQFLDENAQPIIRSATTYVIEGDITEEEFEAIRNHCINPVDSRETGLQKPETLVTEFKDPEDVKIFDGFRDMEEAPLKELYSSLNLAMTFKDFLHIQNYFKNEEKRDPSMTEIRVLDTYWSDHCRHTTFSTELTQVKFDEGDYKTPIVDTYNRYLSDREVLYKGRDDKFVCLMDLALMAMKKLKSEGKLQDQEESDEINACSIVVPVDVNGKEEEWLINFKNETHNHPTEIEPFGGAATCLGGAIRDPLSGRTYVYQAMRVTGAADPTVSVKETLKGKLPQKKLVRSAAHGYSSYGNQIGLATGYVKEVYHPNYVAKRMEIGAVMGAAPRRAVIRENSDPGDIIILLCLLYTSHYSQLGDYKCPSCGFARPEIKYDAHDVKVGDQLSFQVEDKHLTANYKGFYNVYNILAAYAGLRTAGFSGEHFQNMLQKFNPENGRMEQFRIKGTGVMLNLAKNPAGFNQNISAVMQDKTQKDIIITINDNAQDGTDISWLWDVDFDLLGDASIHSITVSGIRCQDMRLRMKYVDIPVMLEENVETAIRKRIEDGVGNLYVLVNYTALFSTHNILKKMEGEKE